MQLTGIILAGGSSSRMGQEKAFIEFEGRRLIDRSVHVLESICDELIISANSQMGQYKGWPVVGDEYHQAGPIAGLHAALKSSKNEHHLVIPCDVPKMTPHVFEILLKHRQDEDQAVIAGTPDEYSEPLIGYYHKSALSIIEEQIEMKNFKIHDALDRMKSRIVIFENETLFTNINSPDDLNIFKLESFAEKEE